MYSIHTGIRYILLEWIIQVTVDRKSLHIHAHFPKRNEAKAHIVQKSDHTSVMNTGTRFAERLQPL